MHHRIGFNKSLLQVLPEIVSISYSKFENDFPSYMHSHTASEIIFVINGHGSLDMLSESYPMERGSVLLVNRNVLHTERQLPDKRAVEYYVVMLQNIYFANTGKPSENEEDATVNVFLIDFLKDRFNEINELFSKMYKEAQGETEYGANLTLAYLIQFLSILVRHAKVRIETSLPEDSDYSSIVGYAKQYIDGYYNTNFKISDLAQHISVSYSHLYHKFKKEMGITPMDYKLNVQLDEAKAMLKNSDFRIGQICIQSGFNNSAYFTKLFRKRFGVTPTEYRKSLSNKKKHKSSHEK